MEKLNLADVLVDMDKLRKTAEQGDVLAQYHLGVCYYNGVCVKQNYDEAFN